MNFRNCWFFLVCRVVEMDVPRGMVEVRSAKALATDPPKTFTFDAVYDWK
jgi:kinesin family protein 3/17